MGKRSTFKRRRNDLYRTPWDPVPLLAPHLPTRFRYAEPCAGNGRLIDHLRWIEGSKHTGKDNCAWHLFTAGNHGRTEFVGRSDATKKNNAQRWAHYEQ
ncbi:hypothetical protein PhaeoP48_02925 [Phaeobacter inhibens]|uniref:hypothetical protein n=1 Tax=Phaeobacter inhibens TaxID=221822 RepID=UPI000C99F2FF|nr:hypothetical protein [Phaeobacter inhibens]AUR12887.1 hypothetical protein PhaeoP48_02925 [Phaeobacter inhibens]